MTSRYIYDEQDRLLRWAEQHMVAQTFGDDAAAIGHERNGELVGVIAYDHFSQRSCMLHAASDGSKRWISREFIVRAMAYPFLQCKLHRMNCMVSVANEESLKFCEHFGWTPEGRLREEGPFGEDMIVFGLLRRECQWLWATGKRSPRTL